jgi:type I restriction enzyme S subunit
VTIKLREYGDIPVIGPAAIRPLELTLSAINKTSSVDLPANAPTVEAGDVVINLIGNHLGEAALVGADLAGNYISVHVALVRPDRSKIYPEYLAIALNGEYVQRQIAQLFTGALIKGLPLNKIKKITLPLPSLNAQRQIIDVISRAHTALDNAKKELSVLETRFSDLVRTVTSGRVRE